MSTSAFLVVILLLVGCCQFSFAIAKCKKNQLKATIVSVDENTFTVRYKIENTEKTKEVCALKWNTMMDDEYWASAVEVWRDTGTSGMPYSKPVIPLRQSEATSNDYQHFGKGQSIEFTQSLSDFFSFEDNKIYWLQIETKINDCYKTTTPNTCTPREAKKQTELEYNIKSDASISQYFTAKATKHAPKQKFDDWLATQSPSETYTRPSGGGTIFAVIGPIGNPQYTKLKNAHDSSKMYLAETVNYLMDKNKAKPLYKNWFGTYSAGNYKQVQDYFTETNDGIKQPYVYNILPPKLCGTNFIAHVDSVLKGKNQHVVNVCPKFFTSSDSIVSLIHEMTHDSAATEDEEYNGVVAYGPINASNLAANDPDKAINNAENYAIFAEKVHKALNPPKRKAGGSCSSTRPGKRSKPLRHLIMNVLLGRLMKLSLLSSK